MLVTRGSWNGLIASGQSRLSALYPLYRVDHVADGGTIDLANGQKIRLVQIDTPEVYFGVECYGQQASAITKRLLPPGTLVRLAPEPATDGSTSTAGCSATCSASATG
jgi:endonuclease YncB( thermonuclease family)